MKRSQKAAPKNLSQTIAKPFARKKYDFTQEGDPKAGPELSAGDTKALARLIRKYENKTVVAAAKVLPPGRGPGRPSRGLLPYYERMHLTEWIEERAEEHRQNGSTKPYIEAEIDLYEMFFGEETPRDLQKISPDHQKVTPARAARFDRTSAEHSKASFVQRTARFNSDATALSKALALL